MADFGIARLLGRYPGCEGEGEGPRPQAGTIAYMAPEVFRGLAADEFSDQWALCVSLWETLYRELPFEGPTASAVFMAIADGPPKPPRSAPVPRAVDGVLRRGLSLAKEERYPDMRSVRSELHALRVPKAPRRRRRGSNNWAIAGLAMLMVFAGVLAVMALQQTRTKLAGRASDYNRPD